jgi:hypothetical protein
MRLTTQIHRFLISGAMLALLGGAIATQPTIQDQIGDAVLAEEALSDLPVVIIIEKAPASTQAGSWRQMLPASLGPRRG